MSAATRVALGEVARSTGLPIRYADRAAKRRYAHELARVAGCPPDVAAYAVCAEDPWVLRFGANRNALLLDQVGGLFVTVDDDTICTLGLAPGGAEGCAFLSGGDPGSQLWAFPTRDAAIAFVAAIDVDFLALHEAVLGRRLGALVTDAAQLDGARAGLLRALAEGQGRVALSFTGILGECGLALNAPYTELPAESRERLFGTEERWAVARASREAVRASERTTITDTPLCLTRALGIDHRDLVPPFVPVLAGEDFTFGMMLRFCDPSAYSAHLREVLLHSPLGERSTATVEGFRTPATRIVRWSVESTPIDPTHRTAEARLAAVGRQLRALGALPLGELEDWCRREHWKAGAGAIAHFERLLDLYGGPEWWANDLREQVRQVRESWSRTAFLELGDSGEVEPPTQDGVVRMVRNLLERYGLLVEAWPAILGAARELRAAGVRVTEPV